MEIKEKITQWTFHTDASSEIINTETRIQLRAPFRRNAASIKILQSNKSSMQQYSN